MGETYPEIGMRLVRRFGPVGPHEAGLYLLWLYLLWLYLLWLYLLYYYRCASSASPP